MDKRLLEIVKQALKEDIGKKDITTDSLIPRNKKIRAVIIFKEPAVVCGLEIARSAFRLLDKGIRFKTIYRDGDRVKRGSKVAYLQGDARAILTAERVALNFLSHLSGIATLTRQFVDKVHPLKIKITDTRKTLPNLRLLQKYAVRCGGGHNHRLGLSEMALIKDNHKKIMSAEYGLGKLINKARFNAVGMKIEIEVENLKEYKAALRENPDIIMLDNMSIADIGKAVKFKIANPKFKSIKLEASGKVNLTNVRRIASTGIDMISVGRLTHSSAAADISLEIVNLLKAGGDR